LFESVECHFLNTDCHYIVDITLSKSKLFRYYKEHPNLNKKRGTYKLLHLNT